MGRPATLKVDIIADAKGVKRGVDQADSSFGKLGKSAARAGKLAGAGVAAVVVAAGAFAVASVKAASDVEQSFGALDSIYGKNSATVKAWAGKAAQSVGLSKAAYAGLSATVGSQLQNMGRSSKEAATQSDALIKRGADLAATFGGSVSDAVGAVSSLLKGERDPIEKYGVSIKQADVTARLAAQGLGGLTGKAKAQAEATATLDLLTAQTAKTTGAFGRESGTLAGQQERLRAQFENVKATVGAKLLPVVTRLFSWLNEKLLPGAKQLGLELSARFGPTIRKVGAFITGQLVPAASKLYTWFVAKIVPAIRSYVTPVLAGLRSAFASVSSSVQGNSGNLSKLARFLGAVIPPVARTLAKILGSQLGFAFKAMGKIIGGVITTIATLVGWISSAVNKVRELGRAISSSPIGKLGKLAGGLFGASVIGMRPQLVSPTSSINGQRDLARASWAQAALGVPSIADRAGTFRSAVTYQDNRSFTGTVEGTVVDPMGAARAIEKLLRDFAAATGRAPAFGRPA